MKTLEWEDNKLKLIDQTKLPDELTYVYCNDYKEVIVAIKDMIVRELQLLELQQLLGWHWLICMVKI